jgi:hypothetical protein
MKEYLESTRDEQVGKGKYTFLEWAREEQGSGHRWVEQERHRSIE